MSLRRQLTLWRQFGTSLSARQPEHTASNTLLGLLRNFERPVDFAFGYGSGVFSQGLGQRNSRTQIDLILAVNDPVEWHRANIARNPHHYSSLKHLGPGFITSIQESLGAGIYFNPYCKMDGLQVKYGVVSLSTILDDLMNWRTLYLAGRLHKPVQILTHNTEVQTAQQENLASALSIALMLLPEHFSERDLYMKIAGISYMGDVRMAVAENPKKIQNIVDNQFQLFRKLYTPLMEQFDLEILGDITAPPGPEAHGVPLSHTNSFDELRGRLPQKFANRIPLTRSTRAAVASAVRKTVKWPSFAQSAKGILSAGIGRSIVYGWEKLSKRWL